MKVRYGFVSNSSSSSFVIAFKGENKVELQKKLRDAFNADNYPIKAMSKIGDFIYDRIEEEHFNTKTLLKRHYSDSVDGLPSRFKPLAKKIEDGWAIYEGSFEDQSGDTLEFILCHSDIDYKSDDLIIHQKAGY